MTPQPIPRPPRVPLDQITPQQVRAVLRRIRRGEPGYAAKFGSAI